LEFLGIAKENMHFVSFYFLLHGFYWLDPWRSIRIYNLHQVLSLLFAEKAIAKVVRRSKMVYTLLDFTLLGLLSQGSKRAYNP